MRPLCGDETWGAALRWAADRLRDVTGAVRLESELLMVHVLGVPRTHLLAHLETSLEPVQAAILGEAVERRAAGEPLPYITGHVEFFGLNFFVTPDVLVPRPETEELLETALGWLKERAGDAPVGAGLAAVDVGTGSGCIVVTLALHAPGLRLYATDISTPALWVAQSNAVRHEMAGQITFLEGDLLTPLPGRVDLIVSNPPYIAADEWDNLPISVQREPEIALLAGEDGLDALRGLLLQAGGYLKPGGLMVVEIGERQGAAALNLVQSAFPGAGVWVLQDLSGEDRILKVQLPEL